MDRTPEHDFGSPVYAVYYADQNFANSPKDIFTELKDAAKFAKSPEAKSNGARFKRFPSTQEALSFLASGDACPSPFVTSTADDKKPVGEPKIAFPSLSAPQKTALKKHVEKDEIEQFCDKIDSNPRYIINTDGDTAAIIMEGFRYNILHLAAKSGKVLAIDELFKRLNSVDYYLKCYGTSLEDVAFRKQNILNAYLNTPDKGSCDTPLHMAAKFGHPEVIKVLLSQPLLDKTLRNKEDKLASDVICDRYNGEDKTTKKQEIALLLNGWFVALYRNSLDATNTRVDSIDHFPKLTIIVNNATISSSPDKAKYQLAACAGPFLSQPEADMFYKEWTTSKKEIKEIKLTDSEKGYERVGRQLAKEKGIIWNESWFFIDNRLLNLEDDSSLDVLESFFKSRRSGSKDNSGESKENINRRLSFGSDSDEEDYQGRLFDDDVEEDVFEDAPEFFLDTSLNGLEFQLEKLSLTSPINLIKREPLMCEDDRFVTPPSSPPPIYVLNEPTKTDNDLFLALSLLDRQRIDRCPSISHFMRKIASLSAKVRMDWPTKDSPRRNRSISRRPLFQLD
ncbi:unnamed protein product [Auanema sp. JU1783]|nr:unnamed protein product [Auanema sp. JU1783]